MFCLHDPTFEGNVRDVGGWSRRRSGASRERTVALVRRVGDRCEGKGKGKRERDGRVCEREREHSLAQSKRWLRVRTGTGAEAGEGAERPHIVIVIFENVILEGAPDHGQIVVIVLLKVS